MEISEVKNQQLNIGELLSVSFSVWLRTFWSAFKLSIVFFILAAGAFFAALLCYVSMSTVFALSAVIAIFTVAVFVLSFSFFVFSLIAEDVVTGASNSLLENLAKVYSSIHILIGASIIITLVFMACFLPVLLFKNPLILLPSILLLFLLYIVLMPFISFFPMAVLLRGAGVIDSLKYSYYMVKGRWFKVFGWILLIGVINAICSVILQVALKVIFSSFLPSASSNFMNSFLMGGGIIGIILILISLLFATMFVSLLFYSFFMSAMTVMFLNLEVVNAPPADDDPYSDEEDIHGAALNVPEPPHEITEMFKNIKPVDVNVSTNTERRTALGPLSREQALRQFKKDDQITFPPLNKPVTEPKIVAPAQPVVNIPEDLPSAPPPVPQDAAHPDNGGLPTITVRQHVVKGSSFPSIYKPEDTK